MLRIENLLLRGDGQVTQAQMLEETSLVQGVQGVGGPPGENGSGVVGRSAGGAASGGAGGAGGGGNGVAAGGPSGANGVHHESALGEWGLWREGECHSCFFFFFEKLSLRLGFGLS